MSNYTPDELDRQIIELLFEDARISNRKLAAKLDFTEGTIRSRVKRLEDENLIFAVIEEQRALVDTASSKTREARRFAERRDRSLTSVESSAIEENDPEHAESGDILDVPTFEVEEWS